MPSAFTMLEEQTKKFMQPQVTVSTPEVIQQVKMLTAPPPFKTLANYNQAKSQFPNMTNPGYLWEAWRFNRVPADFFRDATMHHNRTLANNPAAQKSYRDLIRRILQTSHDENQIKSRIAFNTLTGNRAITVFFPEWGDWWAGWRIKNDLTQWLKDCITVNSNIADETARQNHENYTQSLLEKYAPEGWTEGIDKELAANFVKQFLADDIQAAATASQIASEEQAKKIGLAILVGGGALAAFAILTKKRR